MSNQQNGWLIFAFICIIGPGELLSDQNRVQFLVHPRFLWPYISQIMVCVNCELAHYKAHANFVPPRIIKKHKEKYFKFCVMRRDQRQERVCWISAKNWVLFMVTEKWARQKRRFWLIENIDSRFPAVISPVSLSLTYFLLTTKINEIRRLRALQVTFILV